MAYYKRGLLGALEGTLLNLNFYVSKGINCVRAKRKNAILLPASPQTFYKLSFKRYSDFCKRIKKDVTDLYLKNDILTKNKWLLFFKLNLINAYDSGLINYSLLKVSNGDLFTPIASNITFVASPRSINIYYPNTYDNINSFQSDIFKGFIYNKTRDELVFICAVNYRYQALGKIYVPITWLPTHSGFVYYWFISQDGNRISSNRCFVFN